jgi:4-amino-4-deoxy-L-arabinose transferase-like glycosyltransferase
MITSTTPALPANIESRLAKHGTLFGAAAIFLLTFACHLPLLGNPPLAGTEGLRVIPAHDMVRTGDWILIRLYGQLYLIKPPLHDWLIAISEIISRTGGNEFVWRLPSLIGAAFLNVALYLFGARWFGRLGGIVSGICGLGLLALWGQARTADVDGTNTLACTLAILCLIELHFGSPTRRWPWIWGGGIAFGATLMTKGPAGIPIIIGELLWLIICSARSTGFRGVRRALASPAAWAPLLIGAALFGAYGFAAWRALHHLQTTPDFSGLQEVNKTLYPDSIPRIASALLVPFLTFAFSLPVSLALPLVLIPGFRNAIKASGNEDIQRVRITDALAASVLLSWLVCLLTGMVNVRYAYVTITPLCLLGGALAASVPFQGERPANILRAIVSGSALVLLGGYWFIAIGLAWKGGIGKPVMLFAGVLATIIAVIAFRLITTRPSWTPAWGLPMLLMLVAVPFAFQFRVERNEHSGKQAAHDLLAITGPKAAVLGGAVLHSHPEMFFYAGFDAQTTMTFHVQNPSHYAGDRWVVLDPVEYANWTHAAPQRLSRWSQIRCGKDVCYVAWFSESGGDNTRSTK